MISNISNTPKNHVSIYSYLAFIMRYQLTSFNIIQDIVFYNFVKDQNARVCLLFRGFCV